jgi:hypothetical protein
MRSLVVRGLKNHRSSKIQFPDQDTMRRFAALVQAREPLVDNIIGFVDGFSAEIQCSSNHLDQNAYYDGYLHDTFVNNVLVFSPEGKVIAAAINYPGSWHDSTVALNIIDACDAHLENYAICVDQGFPRSGRLLHKFVGPLNVHTRRNLLPELRAYMLRKHAIYVSLRQAAEWGMRALQGTFARLKSRMTSSKPNRQLLILSILYLSNFRAQHVGLNQIATVFNPEYRQLINIEGYDRIARFYQI